MELWLIICKIFLLIFLAFRFIHSDITKLAWVVLSLLLYLCVNIAIYIFKKAAPKKVILFVSILITITSVIYINPLLIVLLPINLCEVSVYYIGSNWLVLVIVLFPLFFLKEDLNSLYGLVAVFSFLVFIMNDRYSSRLVKLEDQMDKMRKDLHRLSKNLNEHNEYKRQSEYTYKLEERTRLSQEIHDKIGHSMTGALIQMEAAKRLMISDKDKAGELLQNAINISKDGIESIRITLKNIKPPTEQLGINRLRLIIDEFSAKHPIKTSFLFAGNVDIISPIQWKIIHENITEALTNTMKYADATAVSIEIHVLNKLIKVKTNDNGKGAVKFKKGLGIIGMEERAAAINGTVIVDGTDGFSVTTLLPIHD